MGRLKKYKMKIALCFPSTHNENMENNLPDDTIERYILVIRGEKVMLDTDLAKLYGVTTKRLNEQVRRNIMRFPPDFMFQLDETENEFLRSHFATLESGRGKHRKYLPLAFTEQGVAMLSSVLTSPRAIQVNIAIMRAFVKLRQLLITNENLAQKIIGIERKYDDQFELVFNLFRHMENEGVDDNKPPIGFVAPSEERD